MNNKAYLIWLLAIIILGTALVYVIRQPWVKLNQALNTTTEVKQTEEPTK